MEAIKDTIAQLNTTFHSKLAEFEERQLRMSSLPSPDAANLAAEFGVFKAFVISALKTLQTQVEMIARSNDNLEMHNRRNIFLLHGVAECKNSSIEATVVDTLVKKLKLKDFKAEDISRCHRIGRESSSAKPRPVLFEVHSFSMRNDIWTAKKNLKNSGITLSEFLTKPRHDVFMLARQRFGISKCWTHLGFIFVLGADGVRHRICCVADLEKLNGLDASVPAPKQPAVAAKEPAAASKPRRAASAARK